MVHKSYAVLFICLLNEIVGQELPTLSPPVVSQDCMKRGICEMAENYPTELARKLIQELKEKNILIADDTVLNINQETEAPKEMDYFPRGGTDEGRKDHRFNGGASDEEINPRFYGGASEEEISPRFNGGTSEEEISPRFNGGASEEEISSRFNGGASEEETGYRNNDSESEEERTQWSSGGVITPLGNGHHQTNGVEINNWPYHSNNRNNNRHYPHRHQYHHHHHHHQSGVYGGSRHNIPYDNPSEERTGNVIRLCESTIQYEIPKIAENRNNTWKFVINDEREPLQTFRAERCIENRSKCSEEMKFLPNYDGVCVQGWTLREMYYIEDNGIIAKDYFKTPSCCSCRLLHNDK